MTDPWLRQGTADTMADRIRNMVRLGHSRKEIRETLGTTPRYISQIICADADPDKYRKKYRPNKLLSDKKRRARDPEYRRRNNHRLEKLNADRKKRAAERKLQQPHR